MNLQDAITHVREDAIFREMTPNTAKHYARIHETMDKRQALWGGNVSVITPETEKLSATLRRSLAFEKAMQDIPIHIEPYALLAGLSQKDGRIVRGLLPAFILEPELGQCSLHISHKCPDYETLLAIGLSGILENLEKSRANWEAKGAFGTGKWEFYEAVRRECNALIGISNRYGDLAESQNMPELARICRHVPKYGARSFHEALQAIWIYNHCIHETQTKLPIGNIDRILNPYFEADYNAGKITLEQAQELVDAFCLRVNDRVQIDPDVYVVPQNELEGAPEKYFRLNSSHGFAENAGNDDSDAINHWGQNILISGLMPDGSDGTNALTYMFLNAHEKFKLASPVLTVRMHKNSPPELTRRVAQVLKTGGGMPYINNDDIIVTAYEKLGIPREDACAYANSNCWETLIQGMSNQEMIRFVNFLYLLELALNDGQPQLRGRKVKGAPEPNQKYYGMNCCPGNPVVEGVKTGGASSLTSMEDIMAAWKKQMDYMLETSMAHIAKELAENGSHGYYSSDPILSAVMRDCVENMTDLTHGGSRYDLWHMMGEAVSNAADAMAAIQKFVFEEKLVTLERLVEIMNANWEGEEELHARFVNSTSRFGNGLAVPDGYAAEMVDFFVERVAHHARKHTVCIFSPCIGTFSWVISIGKNIGASADGRKRQEPIAANMSPVAGGDRSGPLAAIQSYLKLQTSPMAAGAPIDLRINSQGLEGEEGTNRIAAIIKTFIQQGGNMLTLTVTNVQELYDAIKAPDKYRSLRVRMGGWSAYFVLLGEEAQKLQIERAKYGA